MPKADAVITRAEILAAVEANGTGIGEVKAEIAGMREDATTTGQLIVDELAKQRLEIAAVTTAVRDLMKILMPQPPTDPLAGAFLTHCPLDTSGTIDEAAATRARIAEGVCHGAFAYSKPGVPMTWSPRWQAWVDSGPPIPLLYSPKSVVDAVSWCAGWPDEWRPFLDVEFWQEPQGDFHGREAEFTGPVRELAAICRDHGIRSGIHLETWHLSPTQPDGGTPGARALLEPVLDMIDFVTWSIFEFNLKPAAVEHVARMAAFMADYPSMKWGATAIGVSVPFGTATDSQRVTRAGLVDAILTAHAGTAATISGYYALPQGPESTRDFWDDQVADVVRGVLA